MKLPVKDFPFAVIEESCRKVIADGGFIVQKWTCSGCKARLSGSEPNLLTHNGHCPTCNTVTDILATGCNFTLIIPGGPVTLDQVREMIGAKRNGETLQ